MYLFSFEAVPACFRLISRFLNGMDTGKLFSLRKPPLAPLVHTPSRCSFREVSATAPFLVFSLFYCFVCCIFFVFGRRMCITSLGVMLLIVYSFITSF